MKDWVVKNTSFTNVLIIVLGFLAKFEFESMQLQLQKIPVLNDKVIILETSYKDLNNRFSDHIAQVGGGINSVAKKEDEITFKRGK